MTKLSLFIAYLITYVENLTELIEKLLELPLIVCQDVRNKISLQKSVAFFYISNAQPENIIENKTPFTRAMNL